MSETNGEVIASINGHVRCLVVVPRGSEAPASLLDGLRERGLPIHETCDAPTAMALLAREPINVMILVEPDRLPDGDLLAASAARYFPNLRTWHYGASGIREILKATLHELPEIYVAPPTPPQPQPLDRVTSHDLRDMPSSRLSPEDAGSHSSVTLTADELALLLGENHPTPR